jgi:hemerythrin superfamily protein
LIKARLRGCSVGSWGKVILQDDHKRIKALFREFRAAEEKSPSRRGKVVDQIIEELTVHTYLENEVLYPQVRELVPDLEDDILESYEEHHVADVLVMELAALTPEHERFTAKTTVLIENVTHHIEEEEQVWFPKVREALGRKQLTEPGEQIQDLRPTAPRRPAEPSTLKKAADALLG